MVEFEMDEDLAVIGSIQSSSASAPSPTPTSCEPLPGAGLPPLPGAGLPPLPNGRVAAPTGSRSPVWPHFEKYSVYIDSDNEFNQDGTPKKIEKKRAKCIYCEKTYAADPHSNGTSGLHTHLEGCKKMPGRKPDKKQKNLSFDEGGLVARGATQADCLSACVEMVIIDELAFSFVEGKGFRKFCSIACPYFDVPSRRTLVRHFLTMYSELKLKLKKELASRRVCLTTDTWTSCQNVNYMVITAHFIDDDWKLHKRVLNFCVIANHKGNSIGMLLEQCLLEWGVEKVLTITADNATTNTVAIDYLRNKMKYWTNSQMLFGGRYIHVRCCAHVSNLIVVAGLGKLESSIAAIRNAVKYVRSSPQRLETFKSCVAKEKIECKGLVVLDVATRWNSTYLMLNAALKFKKAFNRMADEDVNAYLGWFGENEGREDDGEPEVTSSSKPPKKRVGPPKELDWNKAEVFVSFLKVFYDMTLKMSLTLQPAIHETFHDLISIEEEIKGLFVQNDDSMCSDENWDFEAKMVLNDMAAGMLKKFEKYWGNLDSINQLLMLALVLDPRYKLGFLEHVLSTYCLEEELAKRKKDEIKAMLVKLFDEYAIPSAVVSDSSSNDFTSSSTTTTRDPKGGKKRDAMTRSWMKEAAASSVVILEHEVDRYIMDPLEKVDPDLDFDILKWWKLNGVKYPGLVTIAKDILAIPVSTVASEACFSTGGRVVNSFRASLTPKMVEALICCQNWLKSGDISSLECDPTIEEMEFYETLESEFSSMGLGATKKTAPATFC